MGDTDTLAPFALVLPGVEYRALAEMAERLAAELHDAENELLNRPDLWPALGLPVRFRQALETTEPWTPTAARAIRFDFHPTEQGWRISEANSDVPGGYIEASKLAALFAAHVPGTKPSGDPAAALCEALMDPASPRRRIALLSAPGFLSDHQIAAFLAVMLRARGCEPIVARPEQLRWIDGAAHFDDGAEVKRIDAIFRFYQGEWLTRQQRDDWRLLFRGGRTPVCNPASALLAESKRLPLLWPQLETAMPTWRELQPQTRNSTVLWTQPQRDWVVKAAYGNTGEMVLSRRWSRPFDYFAARANAVVRPNRWIAQSRFHATTLATPLGSMYPCIGVYTIDGVASGIYGRLSPLPLIDFSALDVAVLIPS